MGEKLRNGSGDARESKGRNQPQMYGMNADEEEMAMSRIGHFAFKFVDIPIYRYPAILHPLEGGNAKPGELEEKFLPGLSGQFGGLFLAEGTGFVKFRGRHKQDASGQTGGSLPKGG